MVASKFLYLDSAPIRADLLQTDLELAQVLDYRQQLNIGFNTLLAEDRLATYQGSLKKLLSEADVLTTTDLNRLLESYLCVLLAVTSISNLEQTQLTSHYDRRKKLVPDHYLSLDPSFLEILLYTNNKTWGTSYGSLGYALNQLSESKHYLSPSELVYSANNFYFKQLQASSNFESIGSGLLNALNQEDTFNDVFIYLQGVELLKTPLLKKNLDTLEFYEKWLPKVLAFYLEPQRTGKSFTALDLMTSNQAEAFSTLQEIARLCLAQGLDDQSFKHLAYDLIHQELAPVFFSLIDELLLFRKQTKFNSDLSSSTSEELLVLEFVKNISLSSPAGVLRKISQILLEELSPPGGYNLLLINLASALLNQAFILTHPSKTIYKDTVILPVKENLPDLLMLSGRVLRLIYLAGTSLKKTNLTHLQTLGQNLIVLTGLETQTSPLALYELAQ